MINENDKKQDVEKYKEDNNYISVDNNFDPDELGFETEVEGVGEDG